MEKRIKIVWILSLVSALVLIGVQCYWLYTQYRYEVTTYIEKLAHDILAIGEEEYEIRKENRNGSFSYKIKRDTEFSDEGGKAKQNTIMAFSSEISNDEESELTKTDTDTQESLDSLISEMKGITLGVLKKKGGMVDLGNLDLYKIYPGKDPDDILVSDLLNNKLINLNIDLNDTGIPDILLSDKVDIKRITKEYITDYSITFNPNMPERSIIDGMNRAFVNREVPFREEALDSLLKKQMPDMPYHLTFVEEKDSISIQSSWEKGGTLFSPCIHVLYAYSPFERKGILIDAGIPPLPLFRQMAGQLLLALGLILLLIGCLIFQIKTILKQRKIGEMRQQFVNTMIHELKRPVQTLKTFVSFLGDKEMRSDEQMTGQVVQDSMFELDNLSAYLNKLKDMVRADDAETPLHLTRFDLRELADKVIRLTHIPAGKEVEFTTQFNMGSPLIEADPIHVANVLSNLIENAIKYSGEKVEIIIQATRRANELWLTVADNGIGIPLVEQDKVFAKFYRGSNMPDLSIPGLGLGLSYVKLISEAHHGSVSLESSPGEGTSITLYLPQ